MQVNMQENTKKKFILWIEDDQLLGNILSEKMNNAEFEVLRVKDGEEAVSWLKDNVPDAVLIDILLPGKINGFAILEMMKKDQRFANVPKVVLSNLSKSVDIERAINLGAKKFLVKSSMSMESILNEIRAEFAG